MIALLKNWKTSLAVVPFLVVAWLVHEGKMSADDAIKFLGAIGAYLALMSKDSK